MNRKTRDRLAAFIAGLLLIATLACGGWDSRPTREDCTCIDALGQTYGCVCGQPNG